MQNRKRDPTATIERRCLRKPPVGYRNSDRLQTTDFCDVTNSRVSESTGDVTCTLSLIYEQEVNCPFCVVRASFEKVLDHYLPHLAAPPAIFGFSSEFVVPCFGDNDSG